jgi:hypothetical protein
MFARLGGLRGRGLGRLSQYYDSNGSPINTAMIGDTITFNVPGQPPGTIWLEQTVNGQPGYTGPFQIPMKPYTLTHNDQTGGWQNRAYSYLNGQKGPLLEISALIVNPNPNTSQPGSAPPSVVVQGPVITGTGVNEAPGPTPVNVSVLNQPLTPGATPQSGGPQYGGPCLSQTYRFILAQGGGFATGANRPGCSQTNSANCDPQFFNTLQDAINYAHSVGEIPYQVLTAQEPWDLIACKVGIDSSRVLGGGIPWWVLIAGAAALYFLL